MKKTVRLFLVFGLLTGLTACGGGQTTFYWYKEGVGPQWFAKDHNECLAEADYFPWTAPAWPPGTEPLPELRFDSLADDWSMSPSSYRRCMEDKGYVQRAPSRKDRQVLPE